jgi:regulatory protein
MKTGPICEVNFRTNSRCLARQIYGCVFFNMGRTITAIKVQKRNPQRVAIYLDGEFAFGLARIVAAWLNVGKALSDEEILRYQEQDTLEVAYQKALHFISYRPRATAEVQKKLVEKGFSEAVIVETLDRLQRNGLLDDAQFAQAWVENRTTFRPRSRRVLAFELRQKGIVDETIDQALGEAIDEESLAYEAGQRPARRLAGLEAREFRTRVGAFLARRGFPYDVVRPVVDRLWSEFHQAGDTPEPDQ